MNYFAYGSNMNINALRSKVNVLEKGSFASLSEHRIKFNKISKDGSGQCNINHTGDKNDVVYGVLYEISDSDLADLDEMEELRYGYVRTEVTVDLQSKESIKAWTYQAVSEYISDGLKPKDSYLNDVISGAMDHELPSHYILSVIALAGKIEASSIAKKSSEPFVRWQARTIEQLGFVNNLLIGLCAGFLAISTSTAFASEAPIIAISTGDKLAIVCGTAGILISLVAGCCLAWNRLVSFRYTLRAVKFRDRNMPLLSAELSKTRHDIILASNLSEFNKGFVDLEESRARTSKLDEYTWYLLTAQILSFLFGSGCIVIDAITRLVRPVLPPVNCVIFQIDPLALLSCAYLTCLCLPAILAAL